MKCIIESCKKKQFARKLCSQHYSHIRNFGYIRTITRFTPRPPIIVGNLTKIPLGVEAKDGYALIDSAYEPLIRPHKWHFDGQYAAARISGHKVRLHKFLMPQTTLEIDHINGNKLDNRMQNLRIVSHSTNMRNQQKERGVCYRKREKRWQAYIGVNYKIISLGYFDNKKEALIARHKAERTYFAL